MDGGGYIGGSYLPVCPAAKSSIRICCDEAKRVPTARSWCIYPNAIDEKRSDSIPATRNHAISDTLCRLNQLLHPVSSHQWMKVTAAFVCSHIFLRHLSSRVYHGRKIRTE